MGSPTPIKDSFVAKLCRNENKPTCAFLTMGESGWCCAKESFVEVQIRERLKQGTMRATGDNCSGPPSFTPK